MGKAEYRKLEDGDFVGKILCCRGIVAFGKTLEECKAELLSTLEDWIVFGLSNDFFIPIVNGICLIRNHYMEMNLKIIKKMLYDDNSYKCLYKRLYSV